MKNVLQIAFAVSALIAVASDGRSQAGEVWPPAAPTARDLRAYPVADAGAGAPTGIPYWREWLVVEDIGFKTQISGGGIATSVHIRNGKVDDSPVKELALKWGIPSAVYDASYDSHGDPYCVLMVRFNDRLLDEALVLKAGTVLNLKTKSNGWLTFEEGPTLLCSVSSRDISATPSIEQIKQSLGNLIVFRDAPIGPTIGSLGPSKPFRCHPGICQRK